MRYMIHDQGRFVVKDTKANAQCHYLNRGRALVALTDGIGKSEIETLGREALVHVPEAELREQVRILREALAGISGVSANENSEPDSMADALGEIQGIVRRALEATKEA